MTAPAIAPMKWRLSTPLHWMDPFLCQYPVENTVRQDGGRLACWGRHVWARDFFVASSGNVTDEIVREYIEKQEVPKPDDNFNVGNGE